MIKTPKVVLTTLTQFCLCVLFICFLLMSVHRYTEYQQVALSNTIREIKKQFFKPWSLVLTTHPISVKLSNASTHRGSKALNHKVCMLGARKGVLQLHSYVVLFHLAANSLNNPLVLLCTKGLFSLLQAPLCRSVGTVLSPLADCASGEGCDVWPQGWTAPDAEDAR